jgi:hypothetical protein
LICRVVVVPGAATMGVVEEEEDGLDGEVVSEEEEEAGDDDDDDDDDSGEVEETAGSGTAPWTGASEVGSEGSSSTAVSEVDELEASSSFDDRTTSAAT